MTSCALLKMHFFQNLACHTKLATYDGWNDTQVSSRLFCDPRFSITGPQRDVGFAGKRLGSSSQVCGKWGPFTLSQLPLSKLRHLYYYYSCKEHDLIPNFLRVTFRTDCVTNMKISRDFSRDLNIKCVTGRYPLLQHRLAILNSSRVVRPIWH